MLTHRRRTSRLSLQQQVHTQYTHCRRLQAVQRTADIAQLRDGVLSLGAASASVGEVDALGTDGTACPAL